MFIRQMLLVLLKYKTSIEICKKKTAKVENNVSDYNKIHRGHTEIYFLCKWNAYRQWSAMKTNILQTANFYI